VRAATLALALAVGGCGSIGPIKAYDGPERSDDEVGVLQTQLQEGAFSINENAVTVVDGVQLKRRGYAARVLPGMHWFGIETTFRATQSHTQFCAFELNVDSACTYSPSLPGYVRSPADEKDGRDLHVSTLMQLQIDCPGLTYATRAPVECATRTLCRDDGGCTAPGTRCVKAEGYSFGACR
jgi:hypothetical protein